MTSTARGAKGLARRYTASRDPSPDASASIGQSASSRCTSDKFYTSGSTHRVLHVGFYILLPARHILATCVRDF